MAYVFDPINNTLIDDEDKSLGNKLALNDDEFQKLLDIPGVFKASEAPTPPPRQEVLDREAINRFIRDNRAEGGKIGGGVIAGKNFGDRTGFANPISPLSSPEVLKRIIELHQKNKLGAEAIANVLTEELGFKVSRAPVGKQITKLKAQGLIKEIPYAERAAAINQRGEFFGKPASEKFMKIREVRDIDRTTRFKDTGKLKYNIPKDAKFKIDFKNPNAALISEIPKELTGIQYYKTKADAQKALDRRNALVLTQPADPDSAATKAGVRRRGRIKANAPFNFSAFGDFEFHHIMNIGGPIGLDTNDVAIVSKTMNRKLAPYNKRLNNIGENILNLIETKPEGYLKKIKEQNKKGKSIVTEVKQKLPKEYRKLIGFNEVVPDGQGGFIGKKFGGSGIKTKGIPFVDLSKNEAKALKKQMVSDLNKFQSAGLKDKILSSTGKVLKGVGKVIKPVGYAIGTKALFDAQALAKEQGIELSNFDKFLAVDSGDPNVAINNYMRRNDPEFAAEERAKDLAKMSDDFEEVGLDEVKPDETLQDFMANGGRAGFSNGGAAGADVDFATQLEYFLTNEDAELPQLSTYKETKNPIEVFNNIIDPRNYPYYADVLARAGVRIGEFGARVLPATGKLISDLIQKPAFKIKKTGNNYVQDYMDELPPSNIKGTGIFSEFLENITPTSLEKKVGLASLIEKEEQKQIDRGSTAGPKVFADTIGLGAEVTAPIFPGLKLLRAYAANRNLPVNDVTKKILVKEIDEVLETQGMDRREFLKVSGAGATVILAKMLGFGDEIAQTAKVAEKAAAAPGGVPPYFFDLVEIIKKKGLDITKKEATQNLQNVYSYKGYDLYEDLATGEIRIEKTNTGVIRSADDVEEGIASQDVMEYKPGRGDESTKGTPPDEYEQGSLFPDVDGKMKEVEDLDVEKLLEFIKNEKVN